MNILGTKHKTYVQISITRLNRKPDFVKQKSILTLQHYFNYEYNSFDFEQIMPHIQILLQ